jgi:hypothetical protein
LGVYPGINETMLGFMISKISDFLSTKRQ